MNSISVFGIGELGLRYIGALRRYNEWQRLIWEPETTAKLMEEFAAIFESVVRPKGTCR